MKRLSFACRRPQRVLALLAGAALCIAAHAGGEQELQKVIVTGNATGQVGVADSANVGTVTRAQLEARTAYRPGELLEAAPGLVVSQHSGEGKANQFYLRGFNLDHGTDLRTSVDGMLVNQRSHGHGQGWTDLNFVIPELATGLRYKKGPYYAAEGDFSSAGAVEITYADRLDAGLAQLGFGQNGYKRALLADSPQWMGGSLLYAVEALRNDGPFERPDDFRKFNGVLRYAQGDAANGWNLTGMAYTGKWNATDQIPLRAVQDGTLGRFGLIDPTDGGEAHRYSLSGTWRRGSEASSTEVQAYIAHWNLELFSNFTYFLDNPVDGDQFAQPDRRTMTALNARHSWASDWFGREGENQAGVQIQSDNIHNALLNTRARQTLSDVRRDHIVETSVGAWFENAVRWTPTFRSVAGLRADHYRFDVRSDLAANSGQRSASVLSPKLSLVFGPWAKSELYVNLGRGFHSNDARGTVIRTDPKSGDPAEPVTPLARSKGYELGLRTSPLPGLQTALSVYGLDLDSELVFVGDAGTTEAGRPSRRIGFELANYYKLDDWLTLDADLAFARARFRDSAPEGNRIPGAVEGVASLALAVDRIGPWFGALQWRYFGPRPLIENNAVRSKATALANASVGYKIGSNARIELEVFNLTDRKVSAIDYFYSSRLPGEPAQGVEDIHFHPIESRSVRLALTMNF
ncbi:TonB-dependent receptor [Variovorax sp. YR752]|uniref:TonB-dependent receptor n=1 Tax=Variovorax sp. YR752 TaxID=1884383 RepID=UPI00313812D9